MMPRMILDEKAETAPLWITVAILMKREAAQYSLNTHCRAVCTGAFLLLGTETAVNDSIELKPTGLTPFLLPD